MAKSISDDVVKATSDEKAEEDWGLILDICDRVNGSPSCAPEVVRAVKKRLNDPRPRVILYGLSLLGALVENCKRPLHLEVCTRDMVEIASKLLQRTGTQQKIADKMKELILKWTSENFKGDHQLGIIESELLPKIRGVGSGSGSRMTASQVQLKEDEDLARAIHLSLREEPSRPAPASQAAPILYPQLGQVSVSPTPARRAFQAPPSRSVRALFDFEAGEDNELTFQAGEIISILDDSDQNWWKGRSYRGEGLFPANFVTSDLTQPAPPPAQVLDRRVRYADEVGGSLVVEKKPEISEEKMDLLLEMLKNADATEGDDEENATLKELEEECKQMAPLVVEKIREVEGAQSELSKLTEQFEDAMALYQRLMKEIPKPTFTVSSTVSAEPEPLPDSTAMSSYAPGSSSQYGYHPSAQQHPGNFYSGPPQSLPPSGMQMGVPAFGQVQVDGPQLSQQAGIPAAETLTSNFQSLGLNNQGYQQYGNPPQQQPLYTQQNPSMQAPVTRVAPLL